MTCPNCSSPFMSTREKINHLAKFDQLRMDLVIEILRELEARIPTFSFLPNTTIPSGPFTIPPVPSGWTPFPPFERPYIGDPPGFPNNGGGTCKFVANDPACVGNASSDATGYVEPSVSDPAGIGTRIDLQQKREVGFGG